MKHFAYLAFWGLVGCSALANPPVSANQAVTHDASNNWLPSAVNGNVPNLPTGSKVGGVVIGSGGGSGTVTSVAASGGSTGLSFTGSPITISGTLTLSGSINWANVSKSGSSLADLATRNFSDLQSKPTTLSGYGITDGQPLDSDLTAVAALTTNSFGLQLLTKTSAANILSYLGISVPLSTANGGTGIDSSAVTDGQLLIGQTSGHTLGLSTLTAGSNVTITNAGHSITIAATGGGGGPGTGSVTSVDLTMPSVFSVSGNPITASGTLAVVFAGAQTANRVLASPDGTTGAVSLRALTSADLPSLSSIYQPLDSDLTAIAALATTPFGRSLLTQADAAATRSTIGAQASGSYLTVGNNLSDVASPGTSRTNLGGTTVGSNLFTLANPSAISFLRVNADNTVTSRTPVQTLGDIGAQPTGSYLVTTNNLSDVANAGSSRTNLGLGTIATHPIADFLQTTLNLSDVSNKPVARTNLGATTIGNNLYVLGNPGAITFFRANADNSVSLLPAGQFLTALSTDNNLSGGTALTVGQEYYDTFTTNRTLTFSGTPGNGGPATVLRANVTTAMTLTFPSSNRIGTSGAVTSLFLPIGLHELSWVFSNAAYWLSDSVVSGAQVGTVKTVTTTYTALITDYEIRGNATGGAFAVNLPAAIGSGQTYRIKKIDSSGNAVTITRAGSDTIDGANTVSLGSQYSSATVVDGAAGAWDKY